MLLRCGGGGAGAGGELGPRDQQDQRQRRDVRQDAGQARDPWVVVPLIEKFFFYFLKSFSLIEDYSNLPTLCDADR